MPDERRGRSGGAAVAAVAAGSMAANVLAYLLGMVGAHLLGPDGYGALGALLGLLVLGSVGATAVQTVTARRTATARLAGEAPGRVAGELLGAGVVLAGAVTALGLVAAPLVAPFLHVPVAAAAAVAVTLGPTTLIGSLQGVLQGAERFRELAVVFAVATGGRVAGSLAGLLAFGTSGWTVAGGAAGTALAAVPVWRRWAVPLRWGRLADGLVESLHATGALLGFFVLANVDVLLARHRLGATAAGVYAAGAIVAKAALWLPQVVTVLALPRLVGDGSRARSLRVALGAVAAVEGVTACGVWLTAPLVVRLVGGGEYDALRARVPLFAVLGGVLALGQLLVVGRLALRSRAVTGLVWLGVGVQVLLAGFVLPATVGALLAGSIAGAATLVGAALAVEWRSARPDGTRAAAPRAAEPAPGPLTIGA